MTGPEHYKAAERLLEVADALTAHGQRSDATDRNDVFRQASMATAAAQAHAALALADATAKAACYDAASPPGAWKGEWMKVLTG